MEEPKNILITGASGLIGTRLAELLASQSKEVSTLSRSAKSKNRYHWDPAKAYIDSDALVQKDAIIHLAGAGVGDKRWTLSRKKEILKSRTESTQLLYTSLKKGGHTVKHFVSASAIGYYGFENEEKWYDEESASGNDFLARVTKAWEDEVDKIASLGIRVVKVRIGIVLSEKGGALKQMATPVKFLVGAPLGTGKQPVSWIHLEDVCGIFLKALNDQRMHGAFNAVAPSPVDNKTLTRFIGKALNRPVIFPSVPAFALKAIIGEMAEIVVSGNKVSAKKILEAGFQFKFDDAQEAVNDLLKK